jgi:predicted transcriptional regulator of viral defense system
MTGRVIDEALELALGQFGFVTARDLKELGANPALVRQWLRRDRVTRVAHGIYRFPQVPASQLDPYMLATLWPAGRGVLSHETALELHDLCDVNPTKIHITVPTGYRPRRQGGELYVVRHEDLDDRQLTWHEGIRIVTEYVAIRQGSDSGVPGHLLRQAVETARNRGRITAAQRGELGNRLEARV